MSCIIIELCYKISQTPLIEEVYEAASVGNYPSLSDSLTNKVRDSHSLETGWLICGH